MINLLAFTLVSQLNYVTLEQYHLAVDGNDYAPACMRAQLAQPLYRPTTIMLGRRRYVFAETCDIVRPNVTISSGEHVFGTVSAVSGYEMPSISCQNSTCIRTVSAGSYVGGTYGTYVVPPDALARGDNFEFSHFTMYGPGSTTGSRDRHGFHILTGGGIIEDVFIRFFRGVGIRQNCSAGSSDPNNLGNCNGNIIRHVRVYDTGDFCLLTGGGDANQVRFENVSLNDCGEDVANWTAASSAISCTGRICTVTVGSSAAFRENDIVSITGVTDSAAAAANWVRGVVTALTPTTMTVNTQYDDLNIPNGAFVDGVGSLVGRAASLHETSLIGNLYTSVSVNGPSTGDGFFTSGGGDSVFLMCYAEGALASCIHTPSLVFGGRHNPRPGLTNVIDGASSGITTRPRISGSYGDPATAGSLIAWLGGASAAEVFRLEEQGSTGSIQIGRDVNPAFPDFWDFSDGASTTTIFARLATLQGTRTGPRGQPWFTYADLHIGSNINPTYSSATAIHAGLGFRDVDASNCMLIMDRVFEPSAVTVGTPTRITTGTHQLGSSLNDYRVMLLNFAGTGGFALANGEYRADFATSSTVDLYSTALVANTTSGTWTSGTGVAMFAHYECWDSSVGSAGPAANALWAVGDRVWNTDPDDGEPIGWICDGAGASTTWEPIRPADYAAYTLTGATNGAVQGNVSVQYQAFTAGAAGAADDVVWTTSMPFRSRITDIRCTITTGGGGADTITFRDATGGGGAAVSDALAAAAAGTVRLGGTAAPGTIAAGGTLVARRSDRDIAGECAVSLMRY